MPEEVWNCAVTESAERWLRLRTARLSTQWPCFVILRCWTLCSWVAAVPEHLWLAITGCKMFLHGGLWMKLHVHWLRQLCGFTFPPHVHLFAFIWMAECVQTYDSYCIYCGTHGIAGGSNVLHLALTCQWNTNKEQPSHFLANVISLATLTMSQVNRLPVFAC